MYQRLQASHAERIDTQLKFYADGSWEPVEKALRDEVESEELVAANTRANTMGSLTRRRRLKAGCGGEVVFTGRARVLLIRECSDFRNCLIELKRGGVEKRGY